MSVEFDEIESAMARFDAPPYLAVADGDTVLREFSLHSGLAVYLLGTQLLCAVTMLAAIAVSEHVLEVHVDVLIAWGRFARWPGLLVLVCLVGGAINVFFAFNRLVAIKLPDLAVAEHAELRWFSVDSPIGLYRGLGYLFLLAPVIVSLLLLGWAYSQAVAKLAACMRTETECACYTAAKVNAEAVEDVANDGAAGGGADSGVTA